MRLSTLKDGSPDGRLVIASRDQRRAVAANGCASCLLDALENRP